MKTFNRIALVGAMFLAATVASADVVVVVSAKSSVSSLTKDQVADIFMGKSTQATPVDQDSGAAAREEFYTKVTGQSAAQVKSHWAKLSFSGKGTPPKSLGGDDEVKSQVAGNASLIGYIEKAKVDASVKVVFTP